MGITGIYEVICQSCNKIMTYDENAFDLLDGDKYTCKCGVEIRVYLRADYD